MISMGCTFVQYLLVIEIAQEKKKKSKKAIVFYSNTARTIFQHKLKDSRRYTDDL